MRRFSLLGLMLVVALAAVILGLVARLGGEAIYYTFAPIMGAIVGAAMAPGDRWAALKGGLVGGVFQGIVGPLIFRRGYPFPDVAMITGGLFLQALAMHLSLGGLFGALVGAIARSAPRRVRPEA